MATVLNPYLNFHRPCAVAEVVEQPNGKRRRIYRKWATPFEILSQTPQCTSFLRPGVSMDELENFALKQSDTELTSAVRKVEEALAAGARMVLLDNMDLPTLREAVRITAGRAILEISGGVTMDTLRQLAETGVDRISIGTLTKDVKATDFSMRLKEL